MAVAERTRKRKAPATSKDAALKKRAKIIDGAQKELTEQKPTLTRTSENALPKFAAGNTTKPRSKTKGNPSEAIDKPAAVKAYNSDDSEDEKVDEQTAALLKGFESLSDSDAESDINAASKAILDTTTPLPKPLQQKLASASTSTSDKPGVIYIGRIPHGFYEHQMQAYFSQFGNITRLRLSRNKRTGASKHYAFVEFEFESVAKIVADTMDNYLMFGHILKVKFVKPEQVHSDLFKGAGRRFSKMPWNKIEAKRMNKGKDRQTWGRKLQKEEKKRIEKAEKLKQLGYVYEAPELRSVEDVPVKMLNSPEETKLAILENRAITWESAKSESADGAERQIAQEMAAVQPDEHISKEKKKLVIKKFGRKASSGEIVEEKAELEGGAAVTSTRNTRKTSKDVM